MVAHTLIVASKYGRLSVAEELIETGALVDGRDEFGSTAVMWAAEMGHGSIVKLLVDNGADLRNRSPNGANALMWAASQWQFRTMRLIEDLMEQRPLTMFLSYSRKDVDAVSKVYDDLRRLGADPWMDVANLTPGVRWKFELGQRISVCDAVLPFLSSNSVDRRGFFYEEVRQSLEMLRQMPEDRIYIIPVRLDDCKIPNELSHLHCCNLFEETGMDRLTQSIDVLRKQKQRVADQNGR